MTSTPKEVRIHYRRAALLGDATTARTLQEAIAAVMAGALGKDARKRIFPISEDGQHQGCLNFSEKFDRAFVADLMHLDGRRVLPTWIHPENPEPVARVIPKELAAGEASLGEPVYFLIRDNHVAVIERLGFRNMSIQRYLNALISAAGELEAGTEWQLSPKIELSGTSGLTGGIKRIIIKPKAALQGEAEPAATTKAAKPFSKRMNDFFAQGHRVIDMIRAAGADETDIERLKSQLSSDLALKARLEITVASLRRRTEAELTPGAIEQAFAEMASEGDVRLQSQDGKTDGKLIQLVHKTEVLETGGLIDWQRATYALASAITAWAAKGSIDLS